jgi:nicotinamide-nucleotide adenylyltransferase
VKALDWILDGLAVDEVVVVIGSAQESHTLKNPFTAGERFEMILRALGEAGLPREKFHIVPVPDIAMNHVWVRYLEMLLPKFEIVVSRNPLVARLFEEYGYRVERQPMFRREEYSATKIRELMLSGGEWRKYVPLDVAAYIEEIKGVERLREIASRD